MSNELKKSCCEEANREPHGCPYAEEICDDYEKQCTCCESCEQNCADDI